MPIPLDVCFHNLSRTEAIQKTIEKYANRFERVHPRILGCRVTIDGPPRHHRHGNPYEVRIDLALPGHEIVVSPLEGSHVANENLYVSIRESFKAAARQLREHRIKRRSSARRNRAPEVPLTEEAETEVDWEFS